MDDAHMKIANICHLLEDDNCKYNALQHC